MIKKSISKGNRKFVAPCLRKCEQAIKILNVKLVKIKF